MADRTAELGDLIVTAIRSATADLRSNAATVIARLAEFEARALVIEREHAATRERLAAVEARAPIPGPPGKDGAPGADGLTVDDLTATQDPTDPRTFTLGWTRGDVSKAIATFHLPTPRYLGVYTPGAAYAPGDRVTLAGCEWHCNADTSSRPGTGSKDWTLAVKCGRDGKDAPAIAEARR